MNGIASHKKRPGDLTKLTCAVSAAFMASTVFAQDPGAASERPLDVIVVTAQKRAQSIQDVGLAITAFSADSLRELGITDVTQVAMLSPNVDIKFTWGNSMPVFTIRGVGMNSFQASDTASVGLFIDEVFQSSLVFMGPQLFDMERVELLRGPQGALFGRNTNGGAVNYLSRRPTDELEGFVRVDYGRFDRLEVEGGVGGPISESVSGRVSINAIQQNDGYVRNRMTGKDLGEVDIFSGRAQLLFQPQEDLDILFKAYGSRDRSQPSRFKHIAFWNPGATAATPIGDRLCPSYRTGSPDQNECVDALGYSDPDRSPWSGDYTDRADTPINDRMKLNNDIWGATLNVEKALDTFAFTSISSWQRAERFQPKESDANPLLFVDLTFASDITAWSQEFRLMSSTDSPFQWVVGAIYADDRVKEDPPRVIYADDFLGIRASVVYDQKRTAAAGYVQLDWDVSDKWQLSAGGRLIREEIEFASEVAFLFPPDFAMPGFVVSRLPFEPLDLDGKLKTDDYAFRLAANYRVSDEILLYASYSRGFKGGGFNGGLVTNPTLYRPFDPEIVYASEIGLKAEFLDSRLILNTAAFIYDYKGLQAATPRPDPVTGTPLNFLANLDSADIKGFEAELLLRPNAFVDASFGLGYLDTKNKDPGVNFDGPFGTSPRELPNAPQWSLNGVVGLNIPMQNGYSARVTTDASWVSSHYKEIVNNLEISSQYLWNARATLVTPREKLSFALFVQNITNRAYVMDTLTDPLGSGWGVYVYGMPRTWGVSIAYDF